MEASNWVVGKVSGGPSSALELLGLDTLSTALRGYLVLAGWGKTNQGRTLVLPDELRHFGGAASRPRSGSASGEIAG